MLKEGVGWGGGGGGGGGWGLVLFSAQFQINKTQVCLIVRNCAVNTLMKILRSMKRRGGGHMYALLICWSFSRATRVTPSMFASPLFSINRNSSAFWHSKHCAPRSCEWFSIFFIASRYPPPRSRTFTTAAHHARSFPGDATMRCGHAVQGSKWGLINFKAHDDILWQCTEPDSCFLSRNSQNKSP